MNKPVNTEEPRKIYSGKISILMTRISLISGRIKRISFLRILTFVTGILLIYLFSSFSIAAVVWTAVLFGVAFLVIALYHNQLHNTKEEMEVLLKINHEELLSLDKKFGHFAPGDEYNDPQHPFAGDLDIFGEGSIFQYLNRTTTIAGSRRLASWFLFPEKNVDVIKTRQEAVADLSVRLEWRQNFRATGLKLDEGADDIEGLLNWVKKKPDYGKSLFAYLLWFIPFASAAMLYFVIADVVPVRIFLLYVLIPLYIAFSQFRKVGVTHEQVSKKTGLLKKYSRLFKQVENETFSSSHLQELQKKLSAKGIPASIAVRRLSTIVNALDSRLNIFGWLILNYFFLWDILQSRRLDKWCETYKTDMESWFETLSQFDALNSLAGFCFNHPTFVFPEPVPGAFALEAERCGHPLIPENTRIDNPVSLKGWKQFTIVTGANMAGKSTYLRTVAVNFILAMTGAPVCAAKFIFSPSDIYTSIRTRDNLLQNESYFFAELKRLKAIIDILETQTPLLVILDEILKGTNSKDKQMGSAALLRQLIRYGASGLIATHDLSLGNLVHEFPSNIINKRFEVEINNDDLVFDYVLKDGVSQNLNATFLMKKMGITI